MNTGIWPQGQEAQSPTHLLPRRSFELRWAPASSVPQSRMRDGFVLEGLLSEAQGSPAGTGDHVLLLGEHVHFSVRGSRPPQAAAHLLVSGSAWRAEVRTLDVGRSDVLSTTLILFLVEAKAFSGSSEKQQGGARVTVSAPPVEQKPAKDLLADGSSAPSSRCQSSGLSEPAESHQRGFLQPRIPLAGFLCPFQDLCTAPRKDPGVQIEREFPAGKEEGGGAERPLPCCSQEDGWCRVFPGPGSHKLPF